MLQVAFRCLHAFQSTLQATAASDSLKVPLFVAVHNGGKKQKQSKGTAPEGESFDKQISIFISFQGLGPEQQEQGSM